jgi:hypothetical protein
MVRKLRLRLPWQKWSEAPRETSALIGRLEYLGPFHPHASSEIGMYHVFRLDIRLQKEGTIVEGPEKKAFSARSEILSLIVQFRFLSFGLDVKNQRNQRLTIYECYDQIKTCTIWVKQEAS